MAETGETPYDWSSPEVLSNPFPAYARLHAHEPVRYEPSQDGWLIAGYEQVLAAIKDESALRAQVDRSSFLTKWPDARDEAVIVRKFFDSWMLFKDPPDHTRIRGIIQRLYSPAKIKLFRPDLEQAATALLDRLASREVIDIVADYAVPLSRVALERLLGATGDDLSEAARWSDEVAGYMNAEATADSVRQVAKPILELKRFAVAFCTRDNLPEGTVGRALGQAYTKGILDENELTAALTQNITGALAALAQFIAHAVLHLLEDPAEAGRLRSGAVGAGPAVEELLRFDCPFLLIVRQASKDIEVTDVTVPQDAFVGLLIGAANHDPEHFKNPGELDLSRTADSQHFAFGYGAHYCLGAALTRQVAEVGIPAIISRYPGMTIEPDGQERVPSFGIRWLRRLMVRIEPAATAGSLSPSRAMPADGLASEASDIERLVLSFAADLSHRRSELLAAVQEIDDLVGDLRRRYPAVTPAPVEASGVTTKAAAARPVTAPSAGTPRRGGILRVNITNDTDSTDPALAWHATSWQYEFICQAKLLNHPDSPGAEGGTLIPEVAAALPEVSPDKRTYTFTIRSGSDAYRFSTGEVVTAEHFAAAINRVLSPEMNSPASTFAKDIVGADDVLAGRAKKAEGIRVLSGNRLAIELKEVAPDFLSRMGMPFFAPVPLDLPADSSGVECVPSAGPYYVAAREPGQSIVLKRNPHYKHGRPAYPDEIRYRVGMTPHQSLDEIEQGQADYHADGLPVDEGARLGSTYGVNDGRFLVAPMLHFDYIAMNTSRPLFSDVRVRRAVNFALDRPGQLEARGVYGGVVSDHILPPGMPGFRDENTYPLDRPDVARAKAELPPDFAGGRAVFYTNSTLAGPAIGRLVRRDLGRIGIEVEVHEYSEHEKHERVMKPSEPFDLVVTGWVAGYPDPFICMNTLLHGSVIRGAHNYNFAYFDEAGYNAKLDTASRLFPPERYTAYGDLDLDITRNAAPWAVMGNRTRRDFVSARIRGAFHHSVYGIHLGALWIDVGAGDTA